MIAIPFSLYQRMYLSKHINFFQRDTRPVSAIEHFVFDTPEEAFTRSIIRRASLRDMDLISPEVLIRSSQPGHR